MKKTKVIINSVTIKDTSASPDPKKLTSWEYEKDDDVIGDATLLLPKNVNDLLDLANGQVVEIWGGWTTSTDRRYFYGFIDDIKPNGGQIEISCKNEMSLLVRKNVNKIYDSTIDASAGEVSEIVEDLIETYGGMTAVVQASGTEDGKRVDQFKCVNADIFERITTLKKALDWDLYYNDSERKVYFNPPGFTDSGITLTVGSTIVAMPEWEFDNSNMINDLRIDGATTQTNLTESGQIETTADYLNESVLLTKTPDTVELYMDANSTPTTQKIGGSKDASTGHFYYVDKENKKIMPKTGTTFTTDHYAIVNYVWSAPAPIHMINDISIQTYGRYQKAVELSDVSSVADAESRGASILSKRSVPFKTGILQVKSQAANIPLRGQTISIIDTKTPMVNGLVLSGDYVVTKIKYMFPSGIEEIEVGDKTWRLIEWQANTEERIKRLEEQFVRNQDLIIELVEFKNLTAGEIKNRYVKVLEANIAGETLIWGNASFGIWGTGKWGAVAQTSFILGNATAAILGTSPLGSQTSETVDNYVRQYLNTYTENFIDDDFEDTNGTATGWTSGSLDFTSGQIALSSAIDKANGTITTATLISTETSGTFKYELTADGSNWEEVTSGTAHTFSDTGTDLRFRVTENNSTTGEISKITIGDYH